MSQTASETIEGRFVVAYVEGVASVSAAFEDRARRILEDNGITDPQPDEQYPIESFASALEEIGDSIGPATTRKIGSSMTEYVEWPPNVDSVEEAFETMIEMYQQVHGNADDEVTGTYNFETVGEGEARIACTSNYPYPESFAAGVFEGTLDEFTSDANIPRVAEIDAGNGEKCAYELSWQPE